MRDEAAFVEFAQAARSRLRRTAYLLCGDWDQASDHVQEGLIRVYVAWPRLTRAGGEFAYARKAVVSAFMDHARRRSSTEIPGEPDANVPSRQDMAETVTARRPDVGAPRPARPSARVRGAALLRGPERCRHGGAPRLQRRDGQEPDVEALVSLRSMFEDSPHGELVTEGAPSW